MAVLELPETFQIFDPQHRERAVARLAQFGLEGSREDRAAGIAWYPIANRVVRAEAIMDRISAQQAAAVAAVLSPGSDWSARNIPAVAEAVDLHENEWDQIAESNWRSNAELQRRRRNGEASRYERTFRTELVKATLQKRAPNLRMQTDRQLLKARDILRGYTPDSVIPRQTSPKTNAFYQAIAQPYHNRICVPIDYRMADLVANCMRPRETNRGIDADRPPRHDYLERSAYKHHEHIIAAAGQRMADLGGRGFQAMRRPITAQAYLWVLAKSHEQSLPGAKQSRLRPGEMFCGPHRTGQTYTEDA